MNEIDTELQSYCNFYTSQRIAAEGLIQKAVNIDKNLAEWKKQFEEANMKNDVQLVEKVEPKVKKMVENWIRQGQILSEIIDKINQSSTFEEAQEFAVAKMEILEELQQSELKSRPTKEMAEIEKAVKKLINKSKPKGAAAFIKKILSRS